MRQKESELELRTTAVRRRQRPEDEHSYPDHEQRNYPIKVVVYVDRKAVHSIKTISFGNSPVQRDSADPADASSGAAAHDSSSQLPTAGPCAPIPFIT